MYIMLSCCDGTLRRWQTNEKPPRTYTWYRVLNLQIENTNIAVVQQCLWCKYHERLNWNYNCCHERRNGSRFQFIFKKTTFIAYSILLLDFLFTMPVSPWYTLYFIDHSERNLIITRCISSHSYIRMSSSSSKTWWTSPADHTWDDSASFWWYLYYSIHIIV